MAGKLTDAEYERRRIKAIELGRQGLPRHKIADAVRVRYDLVRIWCEDAGIEPHAPINREGNKYHTTGVWGSNCDDFKRHYHTSKAAQAARAQLKAISAVSNG